MFYYACVGRCLSVLVVLFVTVHVSTPYCFVQLLQMAAEFLWHNVSIICSSTQQMAAESV